MTDYEVLVQKFSIANFVTANQRSPTELELAQEVRKAHRQMPNVEEIGLAGYVVKKPQFASVSSASAENANRQAIYQDTGLLAHRAREANARLENLFRGSYGAVKNIKRKLDQIESRLDNLLLLTGSNDAFVYGVEEDFVVQNLIDFDVTTASVENGFVTIGRDGFGLIDLSSVKIKFTATADKGYVGTQSSSSIESLKTDDGEFWEYLVYTGYKQGRVSLVVDVILDEPQLVSECRFTGASAGLNSSMIVTGFYSVDGKTFKTVSPAEVPLQVEENILNIGESVKTIRLLLSKSSFDNTTAVDNQYVYTFALDSIKLYSKNYSANASSTLVAGPYEILDEEGKAVNFTKATADICMSSGDTSGVGVYLSVDGLDWKPVDATSNSIVTFANGSSAGTIDVLDGALSSTKLTDEAFVDLDASDALLNTKVSPDHSAKVIQKSLVLKRNTPTTDLGARTQVYGADSGWVYDTGKHVYRTTVYVTNPAGLSIDLGHTSAYVNGLLLSGLVRLQQGYSVFETTESNYHVVSTGLTKLSDFKKSDPLYPYNHKLLIEGYVYSDLFKGDRVYQGVDEYFGTLCTYVPPEVFAVPDNAGNLTIFTTEDSDGLLFKVKANKADGTWVNETSAVDWSIAGGQNNHLWLKMILTTSEDYQSPVVNSIKMRVV